MIKQNVNIINFDSLYEILEEIKENLSFNIIRHENNKNLLKQEKKGFDNSLIIVNSNIDNLNKDNLLIFKDLPISIIKLIELININLIRLKFNYQSKIKIEKYELNINSKFISKDNINLKLTEKEIEIILYLSSNKKKNNVLDLQKNIWGYSSDLETHTVETHIYRLRKKIKDRFNDKDFIMSHKEGYFIG
tara:strand:- start:981 stop:1553 length:573 start_codon:yes stop_codon:yes gene_type:complete